MTLIKSSVATAIILLGIAGAYFVISNTVNSSLNTANKTNEVKSENNNIVAQNPLIKTISQNSGQKSENSALTTNKNSQNANNNQNLTDQLAKNIGQKILESNPNGAEIINGEPSLTVPNPEEITSQLLVESAQNFDPKSLYPAIKDSDLIISNDNSKEALNKYFAEFQKIVSIAAQNIPEKIFSEELTLENITLLKDAYKKTIQNFYNLTAPSSVLDAHKKQIELLTAKKNILEKILNYQEDPMVTILAANELEKIDKEFVEFSIKLSGIIKNLKFN